MQSLTWEELKTSSAKIVSMHEHLVIRITEEKAKQHNLAITKARGKQQDNILCDLLMVIK